jgi:uncharacterized protein YodC (DUF2158 family)
MWNKLKRWILGHRSHFKRGDSVQPKGGGHLMCVIEVITGSKLPEPVINCQWYEPSTDETRSNLFRESRLQLFNWFKESEINISDVNADRRVAG